MTPASVYADQVGRTGLSEAHRLVLEAVPPAARVLDVGCAAGYLGGALGERNCTLVGVEPNAEDAAQARRHYESVIQGDIEDPRTIAALPRGFDVIVFADVLEHLRDPWTVLGSAAALLSARGRVIVSVPNIGHWTARRAILGGTFPYADFGLFDRTHLRFFTRESAGQLVRDAGYEVVEERFAGAPLPLEHFVTRLGVSGAAVEARVAPLRRRAVSSYPELFALQFVLTLSPGATRRAA